jgi:hypothetical protein
MVSTEVKPLSAKELDELDCGCEDDTCNTPYYLHSACHPESPTWLAYIKSEKSLMLTCAECGETVAIILPYPEQTVARLFDAISLLEQNSGSSDEKCTGVIFGIVSALMCNDHSFECAAASVGHLIAGAIVKHPNWNMRVDCIPEAWKESFRIDEQVDALKSKIEGGDDEHQEVVDDSGEKGTGPDARFN